MEQFQQVTDKVSWVGVRHPELEIFDELFPTHNGTTYNSYVVRGQEKTALIDTVKAPFTEEFLEKIDAAIRDMHLAVGQLRKVTAQLQTYESLLEGNETAQPLLEKGEALKKRIAEWEESLIQPKQKTFQDVINFNNQLNAELMYLRGFIDVAEPALTQGASERLSDLIREWNVLSKERDAIVGEGMAEYNALYKELELPALILKEE